MARAVGGESPILGPKYVFRLPWTPILPRLSVLIPGAWVYGWVGGRWHYWKKIIQPDIVEHWQVVAAWHSAWRVQEEIGTLLTSVNPVDVTDFMFIRDDAWLLDYGRSLAEHAVRQGELRPEGLEKITSYQTRVFAMAATRPCGYLRWSGGGGKTFGMYAAILSRSGPAIVLCPAKARKEWRTESGKKRTSGEKFTTLETHRVLPESERGKNYEDIDAYLERMRQEGRRPVVVVGMEALGDHLDELRRVGATTLVVDEIHELGSSKRMDRHTDEDGNYFYRPAQTKKGDDIRVLSALALSRFSTLSLRVGATGTPIDSSPRRFWSQADLLSPGGLGSYSDFRVRHCEYREDADGHGWDKGSARIPELRRRVWPMFSDVPRSVTHAEMKALRVEATYLALPDRLDVPEDERQNRPSAFAEERKAALREEGRGHQGLLREVNLAEACSRKRRACLLWGQEVLMEPAVEGRGLRASDGKVVVFLARKPMVHAWAEEWRAAFPGVTGWALTGEDSEKVRDTAIDDFAEHPGPCWIIATGHSIGTSKDGMQCADLLVIAQFPEKVGLFLQWIWRVDRKGGKGTRVRVPVAEGTEDDHEVTRITQAFGPIEQLTESPELGPLRDALDGTDDPAVLDSIVSKIYASHGKK